MIALIAQKLGWSEDRAATVIAAGLKSTWVTFLALYLGLSIDAFTQGATTPVLFFAYCKSHFLAWLITNMAAPMYRSIDAAIQTRTTNAGKGA